MDFTIPLYVDYINIDVEHHYLEYRITLIEIPKKDALNFFNYLYFHNHY